MPKNNHILELKNITQVYVSGSQRFVAIEDANLVINEGEFVTLLGPSGCGKSTLLRIVTGLQHPSEGVVLYRDKPLLGVNPHAAIVFQTFALFPWLTAQQNIEVVLKTRDVPPKQRTTRAIELLSLVGLDGFENAYPRELSGGMRQKVGFARAMATEPELLCMDEPFSALDVLSAEALRSELLNLWLSSKIPTQAILMVTHNIEEAVYMADRIVVMEKGPGRIVADMKVDLPHPRQRRDQNFLTLVDNVYAILAGQTQPEHIEMGAAPGETGQMRALPHIIINDLAGLLEHLDKIPDNRADIYRLAGELRVDSNHLLHLTEAAELLSFATIAQGDIYLTPLGKTFAEADILARRKIFAARICRLPLFRWLLDMLRAAHKQQLEKDVIYMALELQFHPEEAKRQIETAINWGRYAKIFAYDDSNETFYFQLGDTALCNSENH